jgi:hypothetical protein
VFLHIANWGTRVLKLRLPDTQLSANTARLFAVGDRAAVRVKGGNVIFSFHSENEEGEDSVQSEGLLASIISIRSELARGDLVGFLRIDRTLVHAAAKPAAKRRTVADLMKNLEATSRKQSRFIRRTLNI